MKNKITRGGLEAIIRENQLKAADKLAEQQVLNQQDKEAMSELKQRYLSAVTSGDTASIDAVNAQLKEVSRRIQDRNVLIEALSIKGNPSMQQNILEAVNSWAEEEKALFTQAEQLYHELLPHHTALVEGLAKLNEIRCAAIALDGNIRDYNNHLSSEHRVTSVDPHYRISSQFMNTLLVQQYVKR